MDANRLDPIAVTPTVARQTPDNAFGTVLARSAGEVVRRGAGVVGGMVGGSPALSTAVAGMNSVVAAVAPMESVAAISRGNLGSVSSGGVTGGSSRGAPGASTSPRGDNWELLEAQRALQSDNQGFSMAYLRLQDEMQRESREFNAVSNIMKVRHDSAKSAINNIR